MGYTLRTLIIVAIVSCAIGLVIGLFIGYHKNSKLSENLKPIQIIGVLLFVGYILLAPETDSVIALGILALIPGEYIGKKIGNGLEKLTEKK